MSPTVIRTNPDDQAALLRAMLRELRILNQLATHNHAGEYDDAVATVDGTGGVALGTAAASDAHLGSTEDPKATS